MLWGQLSPGYNKWVVQMAKPLYSDLALRARISIDELDTKHAVISSKSLSMKQAYFQLVGSRHFVYSYCPFGERDA